MGAAIKGIVVVIVLVISFTAVYYAVEETNLFSGVNSTTTYQIPSDIITNFSRNFTFTSSQSFTFYLTPTITNSLQQCTVTASYSSNVNMSSKYSENRVYWAFLVNPGNSYINVNYNVNSHGASWQNLENSAAVPSEIPSSLKLQYDHSEYFNSSNSNLEVINPPFFKSLTQNLTSNDTTVVEKLRSIYDYIVQNYRYNITYNLGNVPLSAQQVYMLKEGDCEELSYLFESMSRSIGIPSWTQYGILVQENNGLASMGEHAWVQTYIPLSNTTGTLANIDLTVEVGGQDVGRGFLVKYPNSLIEWTDNGNSSAMVSYHTELVASSGIQITERENDVILSFNQTGSIALVQDNIFNLIMSNTSRE
ncbi:MAG: transglutaminase-like domain-containing protein [Thermoplasmatales archaeon]|nr:transglutaminase-like domain-containing protein [Candidatus Thermoplasmatota archaeon]MCL6002837.1 transglutaminase-like domain-containing protein [Candidatus Thermoplasmatota archaeon]MDA8054301.1 transglutaminase-like domain-containing protein [Thermoplasmatales archaeon]